MRRADVTLVTDPRFMGGTAQAFLSDFAALRAAGLRIGLVFHRSEAFFGSDDPINDALVALLDFADVVHAPLSSQTVFLHNPQVFGPRQLGFGRETLSLPICERLFMVAHHPPFLGNGALCYDPIATDRAVVRLSKSKTPVEWLPVSGLVRQQLRSFQPFLAISPEDWPNSFDLFRWTPQRRKLTSDSLVIGRHGRAHPDKWPDLAEDIAASLPGDSLTRVRLLGADTGFFAERGIDCSAWEVMPFGQMDPKAFLDGLDIFSYFHGSNWREAFGRTIAEAMLMGVRCILDPALRPTFAGQAIFCAPAETASVVANIRQNLGTHRAAALAAGDWCRLHLGTEQIAQRYQRILKAPVTYASQGSRSTPPLATLRKWIGFHRRQRLTRTAQWPALLR